MKRPITTLFMLISLDGKISTGDVDQRDFDKDLTTIIGVKEGLYQYYKLEQKTDLRSLNSSKVMKKIGMNKLSEKEIQKTPVNFVLIDNGELTKRGIKNMSKKANNLYIATTIKNTKFQEKNVVYDCYEKKINLENYLEKIYSYGCKKLTIQTGASLNEQLLRKNLIDYISIVVAPCLVGGKETPSLIGGKSLRTIQDIINIKSLDLLECKKLKNSYLHITYKVKN